MNHTDGIDERAIDLIASRVPKALRDEPADIAAGLGARSTAESALTVDAVAERLDVSRSTVYAHRCEWGGYKLGSGAKAAIRFSPSALPTHDDTPPQRPETGVNQRPRGAGHVPAGLRSDRTFCRRVRRDRTSELLPRKALRTVQVSAAEHLDRDQLDTLVAERDELRDLQELAASLLKPMEYEIVRLAEAGVGRAELANRRYLSPRRVKRVLEQARGGMRVRGAFRRARSWGRSRNRERLAMDDRVRRPE